LQRNDVTSSGHCATDKALLFTPVDLDWVARLVGVLGSGLLKGLSERSQVEVSSTVFASTGKHCDFL
jgi:hypothetical protein